eukprot:2759212-Ditylum_brightwellii.AAC.1
MDANLICHSMYKQAVNPLCQICGKYNETIAHIASGCNMLHGTKYTKCYDNVCAYLHKCILQDEGRAVFPNWRKHKATDTPSICLTDSYTLMYSTKQKVDHGVTVNHPDIVYLDDKKRTVLLIDITCPMDVNMISAAATKHKKCHDLEIAMKKQCKLCKIQTVPILIGVLGTLCQNFGTNLAKVSVHACAATIQKEVLL